MTNALSSSVIDRMEVKTDTAITLFAKCSWCQVRVLVTMRGYVISWLTLMPTYVFQKNSDSLSHFFPSNVWSTDTQSRLGESFTSRGHKKWATLCVQVFRPNASFVEASVNLHAGRAMRTCVLNLFWKAVRHGSETCLPYLQPREHHFLSLPCICHL